MAEKQILAYIVRHGKTAMNEQDIFRGDANPPLAKAGFQDAHFLAHYFEPIELSFVVSSDKTRARQTAEIICANRDEDFSLNEGLRAWNIGDFGGKPKTKENRDALEEFVQNPDICVPGGESLNSFRARVHPLLFQAAEAGLNAPDPGMLVVHSSVLHEVGAALSKSGDHESAHVRPGGVVAVFMCDGVLDCTPILKVDKTSKSQNVLGTRRSDTVS